jgi:hypothetical protein
MRCTACHTAQMKTGSGHLFAELRNQTIRPYSDLLLHDMGDGLADKFVEGQAKGNMWRTSPLWGIGYTEKVMGSRAANRLPARRPRPHLTGSRPVARRRSGPRAPALRGAVEGGSDSLIAFLRSL